MSDIQRLNDQELEFALHEYDALRAELDRHENANFEMLKFTLAGAIVIISFALQQHATNAAAWAIASTVPLVVLPAGVFSLAQAKMEMRIGAYIQVFYEERSRALNWEECLRVRSEKNPAPDLLYATGMFGGYVLVGLAGLVVAWLLSSGTVAAQRVLWSETALTAALLVYALVTLVRSDRNSLAQEELKAFRDLRDDKARDPQLGDSD